MRATTTDNGANYVAAFNAFGEDIRGQDDLLLDDPDEPEPEVVDVQMCLRAEGDNPSLPPHHRCRY